MEVKFCYYDQNDSITRVTIPSGSIYRLSQSARLFDDTFKLGSTLCTQVDLDVDKTVVTDQPDFIEIYENDVKKLHLLVDSCNVEDVYYYSYVLTDSMVLFNNNYDWSDLETPTVQNILSTMCLDILGTTAPTVNYLNDLTVNWSQSISARSLISYIAEVNASFARINEFNELQLIPLNRIVSNTINVEDCADFTLGEYHKIEKVVYDYGTASVKIPNTEVSGNTLYINPDNILLTDSGVYTREDIVEHIYDNIVDFEFYNISTSRCLFTDTIKAGDIITFVNDGNSYKTIAQYEWTFNNEWYGGFSLNVQTKQQQETELIGTDFTNDIKVIVDRELNTITQRVSDVEGDVSALQQTSSDIQASFVKKSDEEYQDLVTNIKFNVEGIRISSNDVTTQLLLNSNGMYIQNGGRNVTSIETGQFNMTNWVMQETRNGNCLNIFKRRVD